MDPPEERSGQVPHPLGTGWQVGLKRLSWLQDLAIDLVGFLAFPVPVALERIVVQQRDRCILAGSQEIVGQDLVVVIPP